MAFSKVEDHFWKWKMTYFWSLVNSVTGVIFDCCNITVVTMEMVMPLFHPTLTKTNSFVAEKKICVQLESRSWVNANLKWEQYKKRAKKNSHIPFIPMITFSILPESLDILLMKNSFHHEFDHEVPKNDTDVGPRLNVSFRQLKYHCKNCDCSKWPSYLFSTDNTS